MADRTCYLTAPQFHDLNAACMIVHAAFGHAPFLVGSVLRTKDYRDVDIRLLLPDQEYRGLFGDTTHQVHNPFWSLLCAAISNYLARRTGGLPIDFQVQMQSRANEQYPGDRVAVGIFVGEV